MASSYLSKSKRLIMHNFGFINRSCFLCNSRHLYSSLSSPSLPTQNYASFSRMNSSLNFFCFRSPVYGGRQFHTGSSVSNQVDQLFTEPRSPQEVNFPGGKVKFTSKLAFTSSASEERTPCYRVLNEDGQPIVDSDSLKISKELGVRMYTDMVTLQVMDTIFYEAQRQGRISFYLTTIGEEAINIASAAALTINDFVFPQYREPGVLLWRGFTLQEFANQLFGNKHDYGKGRQMPIHYGSKKLNYITVASTVGTQIPHAVGAAYSMKMEKQDSCSVTYFGDGGSSTVNKRPHNALPLEIFFTSPIYLSQGDFHAALNFAAVMEVPVIFFCRNNGWAISTPIADQLRSDGIVVRGKAYGVPSIRVDGNDALAVYSAVYEARKMAIEKQTPVLIEALTYRAGHHSTSDDSTKYRSVDEIESWRSDQNPVKRFREWIESNGWWSHEAESEHRIKIRKRLSHAIQTAEQIQKPPVSDLFSDVYDVTPKNLTEQEAFLRKNITKHAQDYPSDVPV